MWYPFLKSFITLLSFVMHILSSYSTFPPATLQNNLSFNYILMAYLVTAKLLQYTQQW